MGKSIYVKGAILIDTPMFVYPDAGAYYPEASTDAETIIPDTCYKGEPCLIIDDKHPQSFFNKYYAKSWFTSFFIGSSYLISNFADVFIETDQKIKEFEEFWYTINKPTSSNHLYTLYKMVYLHIVTLLDSFICSIVLTSIIRDSKKFEEIAWLLCPKDMMEAFDVKIGNPIWEQKVVDRLLKTSYANYDTLKGIFKCLDYNISISNNLKQYFRARHIIVHRNGKQKDGMFININDETINSALSDIKDFVESVETAINKKRTDSDSKTKYIV